MIKEGYTICSNKWALDKDIQNELGLLLVIIGLCANEGYCWASNKYFAELYNVNEINISRKIKKLAEKNYIDLTYKKVGGAITKREIRLTKMITAVIKNDKRTLNKNDKYINNNIKNINNNKYYSDNVIDYSQYYDLG